MQLELFGISCEKCRGKLSLHIETKKIKISTLKIKCRECEWEEDLLDKGAELYGSAKKRVKESSSQIAKRLISLKDTLPKDKEEWKEVVKNPKHPFTAALLAALLITMMELSGFGIFMMVTWILGNLVLNPLGWVLVPLIVAIAFKYRSKFKADKLSRLKEKIKKLEQKKESGEIKDGDFELEKDRLLEKFFE